MPLIKTTLDRDIDRQWAEFFGHGERLRPTSGPSRPLLESDGEQELLALPIPNAPLRTTPSDSRLGMSKDPRGVVSQLTDLLLRSDALESLLAAKFPIEPTHAIPRSPSVDLGTFAINPLVSTPACDDPGAAQALLCDAPQEWLERPIPSVAAALSRGDAERLRQMTCRAVMLYIAMYGTLTALTAIDQMRLDHVRASVGRSRSCNATEVHLACWVRLGDDVRVYLAPSFTTLGNTISVSCSHAIVFVPPWMDQHKRDSHSWWMSLAEHSFTHFHDEFGLYREAFLTFYRRKESPRNRARYFGASPASAALRGFLGDRLGSVLAPRGPGFYPVGGADALVAFSEKLNSFVCFTSGEWPFEKGHAAAMVVDAFTATLRMEVSGLRNRLQFDVHSFSEPWP